MPRRYGYFFPVLLLLTGLVVVMPKVARAQWVPGNKAVYNSGGNPAPSQAWIDASAFWTSGTQPDLCAIISGSILTSNYGSANYYPNGAVIDARGLYKNTGGSPPAIILCTGTPFDNLTGPPRPPATTILLPASVIPISNTWTLPNNMKIIGEAPNTILQAAASLTGYMIEMGSSGRCPSSGCTSVGIEHVELDANNNASVGGIDNQWSQGSSYMNDVNLYQFAGTGISIAAPSSGNYPGATNSGPYSNISMSGNPTTGTPVCIDVEAQTRGLHGITCKGNTTTQTRGNAAIYVNASNNSIEDVHVEVFWDGIEIGNTASTVANVVVSNITGSNLNSVTNVVHICGITHPQSATFGQCNNNNSGTVNTVSDVTILQATDFDHPVNHVNNTTVVQDDVTGTSIETCDGCALPLSAAIYVLGEAVGGIPGGYSRFATNPASHGGNYGSQSTYVPTWGVGSSSVAGSSCLTPGALYSNTSGNTNSTVYVCTYNGVSAFFWQPIA